MIPAGSLGILEGQLLVLGEKAAFPRRAPWIVLPRDERALQGFGLQLPQMGRTEEETGFWEELVAPER